MAGFQVTIKIILRKALVMISDIEAYKHGSFYEIFIHRAFNNSDRSKPGFHGSVMQNLIRAENGDTPNIKLLGSFDKQFGKAKTHMHKAMDKYLKMKKIPRENLQKLEILKYKIDSACSSDDLMNVIYESIELTQIEKTND